MAVSPETIFLKGLTNAKYITNFLNLSAGERLIVTSAITSLEGKKGDLADTVTKGPALEKSASEEFDKIIKKFYEEIEDRMKNIRKFAYAMEPTTVQSLQTLYFNCLTLPKLDPDSNSYVDYLNSMKVMARFINKYNTVIADLRTKDVMKADSEDLDIDLKGRKKRKFEKQTGIAATSLEKISDLQAELVTAASESDKALIIEQIDEELAKINSTNARLARLKKKDGKIGKHQHSIMVPAQAIAEMRNRTVLDHAYDGKDLDTKLSALKTAHQALNTATTAVDRLRAMKDIKKAERALYGRRMTERRAQKVDAALNQRDTLISSLSSSRVEDFDKAMKQIKKLDKKILGRKNAKALHTEKSFGGKPIRLVGGTPLIIPTKIAELRKNINAARTI